MLIIQSCAPEDIGNNEMKPVLRFASEPKGLVLNKTNAGLLASNFGNETSAWTGKAIELYPTQTSFQGRIVDAVRVRMPVAPAQQAVPVQASVRAEAPAQPWTTTSTRAC